MSWPKVDEVCAVACVFWLLMHAHNHALMRLVLTHATQTHVPLMSHRVAHSCTCSFMHTHALTHARLMTQILKSHNVDKSVAGMLGV